MSIVLSLAKQNGSVWAAGPEGLFSVTEAGLEPIPQPQQNLYCCSAIHDRVLVGGLPHGVAYSLQGGGDWQAGWMDFVDAPVVTIAPDPNVELSGVLLAGTDGGGILRTVNRGTHWYVRNFGLQNFSILSIVWAPPAPKDAWPNWQYVFAGTEEGLYLSPNGGRGWKRADCPDAVYQTIAIGNDFHTSGVVMAGTEGDGLMRSIDHGHTFVSVEGAPQQINALAWTANGWFLSSESQVFRSADGLAWDAVPGTQAALVFMPDDVGLLAGNENGLFEVEA